MRVFKPGLKELSVSFNQSATRKENGKYDVPFLSFAYRWYLRKTFLIFKKMIIVSDPLLQLGKYDMQKSYWRDKSLLDMQRI